MFREIFEPSEQTYRRKVCEAKKAIREYKGREATEKEIEDYLYTDWMQSKSREGDILWIKN